MKRKGWLVAAGLLLAVAAVLMFYGEKPSPPPVKAEVKFPRRLRDPELQRMEQRRLLPAPPPPAATAKAPAPTGPVRPRDPVLAALTASAKQSAVVIEANAIRYSPVGQLLIDCLSNNPEGNPIEEIKKRAGIDVLQDLDRVAVMDEAVVLSGDFSKAKWKEVLGQEGMVTTSYGDKATLYQRPPRIGKDGKPVSSDQYFVTWGDQMVFMADNLESAHAVVDQLDGRAPPRPSILTEDQTYGEIYGVLSAKDLAEMLPKEQAKLAEQLGKAAERVELHVDTSKDVGVVADVKGSDPAQVEDLGKSLGAAMAMARLQAQANGEKDAAELLDLARIRPDGNRFKMEMAMPLAMLEKQLAVCRNRKGDAQGAPAAPAKP